MLILYALALFISAFLLFSLEPMVGKMLLPRCGGATSVWNTCIVFYQTVLLLGYLYVHMSISLLGVRRQMVIHLVVILLPLLVLPILFSPHAGPPPDQNPLVWLLVQLTLVVGLPFFVASTTAPLLQRWFACLGHARSGDPYFLYSISNAGSLLALLMYPIFIEPRMGLLRQTCFWTAGYALLAIFILGCMAVMLFASRPAAPAPPAARTEDRRPFGPRGKNRGPAPGPASRFRRCTSWVLLALVPSSLMLGVTTYIVTDLASAPLLWVIPLALYLLSFMIVFARKSYLPHWLMIAVMPCVVLLMPLFDFSFSWKFWMTVPVHLLTFFIVAMVCHGELARHRPEPRRLTEFYLCIGIGGVLGGMFNTLVAPQIFPTVVEYPLMLVAACFFRPPNKGFTKRFDFNFRDCMWLLGLIALALTMTIFSYHFLPLNSLLGCALVYGVPAIICLGFTKRPLRFALGVAAVFLIVAFYLSPQSGEAILEERDFYGVKRVSVMKNRFHYLINGNIVHGLQEMYPRPRCEPAGYYSRLGPLGDLSCAFDETKGKRHIAVVGLGVGSMAAYAQPGQQFTFYEIDPAVIRIATDPRLFTCLKECRGKWDVVAGDARLQLARASDGVFDTIILDAFTSDSIPVHLLTQEALELYCRKLKPDGILVFHISNRYLNLEPVLAKLAEENHLVCLSRADLQVTAEERRNGQFPSRYLVMAHRMSDLGKLSENADWHRPLPTVGTPKWTDDYSNIWSLLCW